MPIFDFDCPHCSESFESLMKPYDLVHCPKCGMQGATRRFPLVAGHVWKCNPDGAGARSDANFKAAKSEAKRERVRAIEDKQLKDFT